MSIKEIKERIYKYFSTRSEIGFAYLFGSQAKNEAGRLSDIDIAVYLDEKIDEYKRFDIRLKLIAKAISLLETDKIDLVILNDIPLSLPYRVVRDGKIVYCRDELKRIHFEARIMTRYFDRKYYYDRHTELSIEAIAKEGIL